MINWNVNELDELIRVMSKFEKLSVSMSPSGIKTKKLSDLINVQRP